MQFNAAYGLFTKSSTVKGAAARVKDETDQLPLLITLKGSPGTMVATNSADSRDLAAFRGVIQLFIDGKMNSYNKITVSGTAGEGATAVDKRKYRASLLMIHRMLKTMESNEIAETLEISGELLGEWRSEKAFIALVYSNYREFLIYLGELYT